jgi:hypothetical protein
MRTRFKPILSIVAITVIALHTALWGGTATHAATAPLDPFSVICHSAEGTNPDEAPTGPVSAPSHACDHCNLCGSMPSSAAAPAAVGVRFIPNRPSYALQPTPTVPHGGVEVALKGARGPPVFA